MNANTANRAPSHRHASRYYAAVWRWHFYAGFFVLPFLLTLTLSGLLMLLSKPLDTFFARGLQRIPAPHTANTPTLPASELLKRVIHAYPDKHVQLYIPPTPPPTARSFHALHKQT